MKSNLCDYNDACNLARSDIDIAGRSLVTEAAFKGCAPFSKCITKIDQTTRDNAENVYLVYICRI